VFESNLNIPTKARPFGRAWSLKLAKAHVDLGGGGGLSGG